MVHNEPMRFATCVLLLVFPLAAEPLRPDPGNPRYFQFRGRPTVLITSGEHYGAVINLDFNYRRYLESLEGHGFNLTRIFVGSYVEAAESFGTSLLAGNTLAPALGRFLCPWPRAGGGNKFDLLRFNDAFFTRLAEFTREAGRRGVVVEVNLFSPMYEESIWKVNPMNARNNVNGIGDVERTELLTLKDPRLVTVQEALVRRIVETLREFDNVYYEICNEPYFAGVTANGRTGLGRRSGTPKPASPHVTSSRRTSPTTGRRSRIPTRASLCSTSTTRALPRRWR
jgi:hypothetical protein